ncbi:MAG: carboxypeptidase-like regulatory domain-containing protein [Candidatus Woesearchaeota archaeon]
MAKKRFWLAILLLTTLFISSYAAEAGCCYGITGCARAFFESSCSSLASFNTKECEDIPECDIVACCHSIPDMPKSTYLGICHALEPAPLRPPIHIKSFDTNPSSEAAYAESLCAGSALPNCQYVSCEQPNSQDCQCGSASSTSTSTFCCARDNSAFPNFGACSASPRCKVTDFYNVQGRVETPDGTGVAGADVRAGGKETISSPDGNFTVPFLPDQSSGTVVVIKNGTINSSAYTINGANVLNLIIILDILALPPEGTEICTNGWDDNGNQFFWNSTLEGLADAADKCDVDCNKNYLPRPALTKTVTKTYYIPEAKGEYDATPSGVHDACSDGFDNDCNGYRDCNDPDCADSPACMNTICGDGIIQFPNSAGIYEQCDFYNSAGAPILNADGEPIGNDTLCPEQCIPPGEQKQCTCQYQSICGNGVIDEPLEDCDGTFIAAMDEWDPALYNVGSECTIDMCAKPTEIRSCQCPPPQICGNGVREEPEQCDPGPAGGPTDDSRCRGQCSPDCSCPPQPVVCGNNLLETREDCDGTVTMAGNAWEQFKFRKFGCNPSLCALPKLANDPTKTPYIDPSGFNHGNNYGNYEKNYSLYLTNLGVGGPCECPTSCRASPPGPRIEEIEHKHWERELMVKWNDDCMFENARAYNVYRCEATGPGGAGCDPLTGVYTVINEAPLGITNEYPDRNFEGTTDTEDKYYCYMVEGLYGDMVTDEGTANSFGDPPTLDSEIMCVKAGEEDCFSFKETYPFGEEFCAGYNYNVRSTCDENNTVIMVDDPDDLVDCNEVEEDFGGITEYICVGPYSENEPALAGLTKCVPKSICDYCNDPFGLFGFSSSDGTMWYDTSDFPSIGDFGEAPESPPTDMEKASRLGYLTCVDLEICYIDYSYTSTDKFYAYESNPSCYDFNSLAACTEFNDTVGGGVCDWVWHPEFRELGIGVCRTNITEEQECERCHDPENEVFNRCDRDSCALYGKCYYDRANIGNQTAWYPQLARMTAENPTKRAQKESNSAFYKCTHERDIVCESYDSEIDCVGSFSPYSIAGVANLTTNVVMDVYGNVTSGNFNKQKGTNTIINQSDDFFAFGKCRWVSPEIKNDSDYNPSGQIINSEVYSQQPICMKNSDGSPPEYNFEKRTSTSRLSIKSQSDCGGLVTEPSPRYVLDVFDCRKDFTSPLTNIPHYENLTSPMRIAGVFKLPATVHDNSLQYSSYYPDTYACVAEEGYTCYPDGKADKLGYTAGNLVTYLNVGFNVSYNHSEKGFKTGRHVIKYFSEDMSNNLEEIKNFTVFIDADPPNMNYSMSNVSFELSEDIWRTNLSLKLYVDPQYPEDDQAAFCNAKMYLGNVSIYPSQDIINEYNDSWIREYGLMPDDWYTFNYQCIDNVGNPANKNITIQIDGDKSVTNPQPRGTFNHGDLTISVESGTNAECRYLESIDDLPEFWDNITFDPATYDTMTPFDITGSEAIPSTIHRAAVSVEHGYHRYYVKCKMFTDGKFRGNKADQVRFAVDTEPPVTQHQVDVTAYNGWYNQDVRVTFSCGDPPLMGQGLEWHFACNKTYYCLGQDCAQFEDEFKEYQSIAAPILHFTETTYLSFYSTDKGANAEIPTENVLFQIDKEEPNITIEFFEGEEHAQVLIMNVPYKIIVSSSKPFISPSVESPVMTYASQPSKFTGEIELFPTDDPSVWEGVFFIDNINANRGFEGDGIFTVSGSDHHNVSGTSYITLFIDTKPPEPPILSPSLTVPSPEGSEYQLIGYDLHFYNGTYYTKKDSLFITGFTNELLNMYYMYSSDGVVKEHPYTQTAAHMGHNDFALSGFIGQNEIKIQGDVTERVNNTMFMGFDTLQSYLGPMKTYENYGKFYHIGAVMYKGGDDDYTSLVTFPPLEESIPTDRKVFFYDKETPSYWFGLDVPLDPFQNTTLYLKSYDQSKNLVRLPVVQQVPPYFVFFSDTVAPKVMSHSPREGSTGKTEMDIGIIVKEGKDESGLFEEDINFTINGYAMSYVLEHDEVLEELDPSSYYYHIFFPALLSEDGDYLVSIKATDLAMNDLNEEGASATWLFTLDRSLPADPYFKLIGGFAGPPGDSRWYVDHSPDFIVDFSAERNPVHIVDVAMEDSPTEGGAATCEEIETMNIFLCKFTTPKVSGDAFWADYGVIVKAYKSLDDGTDSHIGEYGPLQFTVDDEAPDFTLALKTRFRDNINMTIGALIMNEHHPLYINMEILGEEYTPLYSSNNAAFYKFIWEVPDYKKDQEGPTSMRVTISDFAQNKRSVTVPVYVDLTAPRIENISIDVSDTIKIADERYTANPNVTISGTFIDDDIEATWISPGDFDEKTKTIEENKNAELIYAGAIPESFKVTVRLIDPGAGKKITEPIIHNYMLINQINSMVINVKDIAGHISNISLRVISDLAPPSDPLFCLGDNAAKCMSEFEDIINEFGTFLNLDYLEDPVDDSPVGDGQVEICHIPDGNPENAHTISVAESALDVHIAHGDTLGPCEEATV